ncbi:hypothetical protein LCGC14_2736920 [marine sediment metagenome]|uniref:Uncharacterized protein n=1 Tax=marine sediment metagenome TaxID=412755 RepID=A0A0F8Z5M3_9ZZZZ
MTDKIEARLKKIEKTNLQLMTENFEISNKIKVIGKSLFEIIDNISILDKQIKELKAKC